MASIDKLKVKISALERKCISLEKQITELSKIRDSFNMLLETTSDFVYIKDCEHRFIAASNPFAEITKHKNRQVIIGKTDFDIFPKEDAAFYYQEQKKVIEEGKELIDIEEPYHDINGNICWVSTSKKPIYNCDGDIVGLIGISRDITTKKELEEKLKQKAFYDGLTELSNKEYFLHESATILKLAKRKEHVIGIFFIDLDGFKKVNDTYGHEMGDYVLHTVAQRLNRTLRESDLISRFGGDEFVLLAAAKAEDDLKHIAMKILEDVCRPMLFKQHEVTVGCSIGIAHFPKHSECIEDLVRKADKAMYKAKSAGKNTYRLFSED